jgi:drug/metabolite transporter (DMT)-like permease
VRSIFLMLTTGLFNSGIIFVPLATATTIMFLTPIITTVLSVFILKEQVGIRRWAGVAMGFVGAIIVVQPWSAFSGTFNTGALFLVAAAVTNASYQIATRSVRIDDPKTSLLFTAAFGAIVCSLLLPWHWQWPGGYGWTLLAGSGFAGALGHYCIIQAFRYAPASVVAPFSYSSLVWATLLGYLLWSDFPSQNVWAGAALIIASGLYIFWRERVKQVA